MGRCGVVCRVCDVHVSACKCCGVYDMCGGCAMMCMLACTFHVHGGVIGGVCCGVCMEVCRMVCVCNHVWMHEDTAARATVQ